MRRLILMRHAKSDWSTPALSDHDRPLNARGRASAKALGAWMRRSNLHPDEVLSSSAQRTGETLEGLDLKPEPKTAFTRSLYLAEPEAMLHVLKEAGGATVLMLGHNPGTCAFAHGLAADPPEHPRFFDYPTGATLVCDFAIDRWSDLEAGTGSLVDFVIPRELPD